MEENVIMVPGSGTKVIVRDVKQEIETAFLDYSMSVIVSRALPDVRDGLKPVHRRILYTMHERGNDPSHPYRKSADTVGAVLGAYHPHGDASVYDAMVRLAQDFSLRYPLVDGQGNFGSVDGDPPAAYRYTEARMSKIACEMLTDIDKDTIDWDPNFDETKKEPHMLRSPTTTSRSPSPWHCPRASPTCWSTAARALRSAWPPTSRRTICAKSSAA